MKKYQIVFCLTGFWFRKLNYEETSLAYIYEWVIGLGFVEIRKWRNLFWNQKNLKNI